MHVIEADDHLSFGQLIDLADGRADATGHANAIEHMAACEQCAADFVLAQRMIAALTAGRTDAPSRRAVAQVQALFRARIPTTPPLIGTLLFDSRTATPAIGFRSAGLGERQLLFVAEDNTIDLHVEPDAARWTISGQVLGPVSQGMVTLAGTQGVAQVALSDLAEFALPPVEAGTYTLTVLIDEREIVIPELIVGGD